MYLGKAMCYSQFSVAETKYLRKNNLKGGRVYSGSWVQWFQSMVTWFLHGEPLAKHVGVCGRTSCSLHRGQEEKREKGVRNKLYFFQGHVSNDLLPLTRRRHLKFPPSPNSPLTFKSMNGLIRSEVGDLTIQSPPKGPISEPFVLETKP